MKVPKELKPTKEGWQRKRERERERERERKGERQRVSLLLLNNERGIP